MTERFRFEYGDTILWVAFGDEKPWPINFWRRGDDLSYKAHPHRPLTDDEEELVRTFANERRAELAALWPEAFASRLNWPHPKPRREKNGHDKGERR